MRLAEFIRANPQAIEQEWESFARSLTSFAAELDISILRNDLREILSAMADDMDSAQTSAQQQLKSKGHGPRGGALDLISATHARARLASGFSLEQAISEYRALRSSILFLWVRSAPRTDEIELSEVTRFNETVDQAIAELVRRYANKDEMLNDRFVGALGHEIRNPLQNIALIAALLDQSPLEQSQRSNLARIRSNAESISRMVDDLAIAVRSRMSLGMPLSREFSDIGGIIEETLKELNTFNSSMIFQIEKSGDLTGAWDKMRLKQIIFNLASNAAAHAADQHAKIDVREAGAEVVLTVSNRGKPIPEEEQQRIFEPFVHQGEAASPLPSSGLGLGLFVVQEIVAAHKGSIAVVSNEIEGTTFTVTLPRIPQDQHP